MKKTFHNARFKKMFVAVFTTLATLLTLDPLSPQNVPAQGVLIEIGVPRPLPRPIFPPHIRPERPKETPYKIESISVDATIVDSIAQVNLTQEFKNEGSTTIETAFVFPLPYDGAIDSMTLLVDGKEYPAKLLNSKEARETYESIVRKNKDPALLEWIGSGMFQTNVFPIPPGEKRTVSISYTQLLRSQNGLTEFLFPLSCAKYSTQKVGKTSFDIMISGDSELKNVYSPTHEVKIDRNGAKTARVSYVTENQTPNSDLRLFFDRGTEDLTAKIQSYRPNENEDGYFLLLATPKIANEERQPLPKTLVFALDVSGSMSGQKIEQARESLKFVLERLRDGDKFNIVTFSSEATAYKTELQTSSAETRADAKAYVDGMRAHGGTNIEDGLKVSMGQIAQDDSGAPKYLLLISDGEPTVKECGEMQLAKIARDENPNGARLFTFGVGYDVNSRLLDRLIADGRGRGEYVRPNENIEDRVSALYQNIESPVYTDVEFSFALKDSDYEKYFTNLIYPSGKIDVFSGEQLVLFGRYSKPGKIVVSAKGKNGEKDVQFEFNGEFIAKSPDSSYSYVERLWAARRVGEIVDCLDLNGRNQELMDELLELAKKHGILTPYTSFLADDSVSLNATSENARVLSANMKMLDSNASGASGFAQRGLKQSYRNMRSLDQETYDAVSENLKIAANSSYAPMSAGGAPTQRRGKVGMLNAPLRMNARTALNVKSRDGERINETKKNDSIKTIAGKTFYFKEGRWIDASIDKTIEKNTDVVELEQFSDKYFQTIETVGQEFSQYLVFDESIELYFLGKIYKIHSAKE